MQLIFKVAGKRMLFFGSFYRNKRSEAPSESKSEQKPILGALIYPQKSYSLPIGYRGNLRTHGSQVRHLSKAPQLHPSN